MGLSARALLAIGVALSLPALADDQDPVVIRVGSAALRESDVARRLAAVPPFQLRTFGNSKEQSAKHLVEAAMVPDLLYADEAERRRLADVPRVRRRIREALRRALSESVRRDVVAAGIPEDELRKYYDAHRDDFEKPERIRIWRILVDDEALARRIMTESARADGPERWSRLAREHSLDAATKMRGGMLGFVWPDGHTDVPQVQVDPVLYAAASKVKDGEIVAEPVKEGAHLAVVWRRGTLAKVSRSLESERSAIRELLTQQRVETSVVALADDLRRREVRDEHPALLEILPSDAPSASSARPRLPGKSEPATPVPQPSERGLR